MTDTLTDAFEAERPRLRAVAYRMLGSLAEADDVLQEAWIRARRASPADIVNLPGWLTTVVARLCLDQLRARRARREDPAGFRLPEPVITPVGTNDPEQEALLADAVGLAMLIVLDTLTPAERLAFVLHDLFGVPFDQIGPIVGRSPATATQLASRARRRLRGAELDTDVDPAQQRQLVEAFRAAARHGDLERLLTVLDPDVVLRVDAGTVTAQAEVRGARAVAARAQTFAPMAVFGQPALVGGLPGLVVMRDGQPFSVLAFTVRAGVIVEIDVFADADRLRALDLSAFA